MVINGTRCTFCGYILKYLHMNILNTADIRKNRNTLFHTKIQKKTHVTHFKAAL